LAIANNASANLSVLSGSVTESFGPPRNFSVGSSPLAIAVADFNRDGKLDLAVANNTW